MHENDQVERLKETQTRALALSGKYLELRSVLPALPYHSVLSENVIHGKQNADASRSL